MTFTVQIPQPWEAFGVDSDTDPTVRVAKVQPDWEPPPETEVHQSVHHIKIMIYGDDPSSAFIHVHGLEEDAVRKKWMNAVKVWGWAKVRDQMWEPR